VVGGIDSKFFANKDNKLSKKNIQDLIDTKEILLALLSVAPWRASALPWSVLSSTTGLNRFTDDLFLLSSLGFVVVCYLVFFAVRQLHSSRLLLWARFIDILFLGALTMQVLVGFLTVYSFV
jgi:hypothetical protein